MPNSTQPYGATNQPGTCLWCGRKLRPYHADAGRVRALVVRIDPPTASCLGSYRAECGGSYQRIEGQERWRCDRCGHERGGIHIYQYRAPGRPCHTCGASDWVAPEVIIGPNVGEGPAWTCRACGVQTSGQIRQHRVPGAENPRLGEQADGLFCGMGCGYQFGLAFARHGQRLKAKVEDKP